MRCIIDKDEKKVIGGTSVVEINEENQSFDRGYCMSKDYWGKGIMSDSLNSVIDYLFSQVGANKITASHDIRNVTSGKLMTKCNILHSKTLKNVQIPNDKGVCNLDVYLILKEEWQK